MPCTVRSALSTVLVAVALAACGANGSGPSTVRSVSVSPDSIVLSVGESAVLDAVVVTDGPAVRTVTWRSSEPSRVSVDGDGRVLALGGGAAVISAASVADANVVGTAMVRVPVVMQVRLAPNGSVTVGIGAIVEVAAEVETLGGASPAVVWSTSDGSVATVDQLGRVSTLGPGSTTIRATSVEDADRFAELEVVVVAGSASTSTSTVTVDDFAVPADGVATTRVRVVLRDDAGHALVASGGTVAFAPPTVGTIGPVTDHQDGTYVATYTAGTTPGSVTFEASLDGTPIVSTASLDLEPVPGTVDWIRQFGTAADETVTGVDVNDDGITAVVGHEEGITVFVRVFDHSGAELWSRREGMDAYSDYPTGVVVDPEGSVYVAGLAQGDWAGGVAGYADAFVRKYDVHGTIRWTRLVTASWGSFYFNAIALTPEGDVVVGGRFEASGESGHRAHKFSASGDLIWSTPVFGSVTYDEIHGITVGVDGTVYVVGKTGGRSTASRPSLRAYSTNGDFLWSATVDIPASTHAYASGVAVVGTGEVARVFLVGQASLPGGYRPWLAEYGSWTWIGPDLGVARGVAVRKETLLVAADGTRFGDQPAEGGTDAFLAAFTLDGDLEHVVSVGTPADETAGGVAVAGGGLVAFAGSTAGRIPAMTSEGGTDAFVAHLF